MSSSPCGCHCSSIAKKAVMALTGLVLVGFIIGHLAGNLLFFRGPLALDAYAAWLHDHPALVWGARGVLLLSVLAHIWSGISLAIENRAARAGGPEVSATRRASLASLTMPYTGVVVLGFIVFHLLHYTLRAVALAPEVVARANAGEVHQMVAAGFKAPAVSAFYIVALALLCLHLSHGVSSMFQTLGLRNERWRGRLDAAAAALGWIVFLGFASIPAAVLAGCTL